MMTTAEILQVKMPDDAGEDSISMLPMLLNSENQPGRPYLIQQAFTGAKDLAIRRGKWKYLAHKGSGGNNYATNPDLKEFAWTDTAPTAKGQLFDLENDPGETKNLALIHPDVVAELESLLKQSLESGRSRPLVSQSK
jgi:arylsulfatase A-like enzyme